MAEARESIGPNQIPEAWFFPERTNKKLQIKSLDMGQRSLSGSILGSNGKFDYCFNEDGTLLASRHFGNPDRNSVIVSGEKDSLVWYTFTSAKNLSEASHKKPSPYLTVGFRYSVGGEDLSEDGDRIIFFRKGELGRILLEEILIKDGEPFEVPPIAVHLIAGKSGFIAEDWELNFSKPNNFHFIKREGLPNESLFVNPNGEKVTVEVKVEREEKRGKNISFLKVSETHLPSGAIKILKTPLNINIREIEKLAFSEGGSWRGIQELVGVQIR